MSEGFPVAKVLGILALEGLIGALTGAGIQTIFFGDGWETGALVVGIGVPAVHTVLTGTVLLIAWGISKNGTGI